MPSPETTPEPDEQGLAWLQSLAADQPPESYASVTPQTESEGAAAEPPAGPAEGMSQLDAIDGTSPKGGEPEPETPEPSRPDWLSSLAEGATFTESSADAANEATPETPPEAAPKWPHLTPRPSVGEEPSRRPAP